MSVYFSKNLRYLRKIKNLSQSKLAEELHINRNKIASYENKIAEPKLSLIPKIAKYFHISIENLLYKNLENHPQLSQKDSLAEHISQEDLELLEEFIRTHYKAESVYKGLAAMHEFDPNFTSSEAFYSRLRLVIERLLKNNEFIIDLFEDKKTLMQ